MAETKSDEIKVPVLPKTPFTVGGRQYVFLVPTFYHGQKYTAEEALDDQELLDALVEELREKKGKPFVSGGLIALVETAGEVKTPAADAKVPAGDPQPNVTKMAELIAACKTADEIDALVVGDERKTVITAAEKAKAALTK